MVTAFLLFPSNQGDTGVLCVRGESLVLSHRKPAFVSAARKAQGCLGLSSNKHVCVETEQSRELSTLSPELFRCVFTWCVHLLSSGRRTCRSQKPDLNIYLILQRQADLVMPFYPPVYPHNVKKIALRISVNSSWGAHRCMWLLWWDVLSFERWFKCWWGAWCWKSHTSYCLTPHPSFLCTNFFLSSVMPLGYYMLQKHQLPRPALFVQPLKAYWHCSWLNCLL